MLSIVLPSYNEEGMIAKTAQTLAALLEQEEIAYELIFVNDGSRDGTQEEIEKAADANPHVRYVTFSRNFGKDAAIFAGLAASKGACVVLMDCDLQHPPATAVEMYRLWEQGYEVVEGIKNSRGKETALHRFSAKTFYKFISKATQVDMSKASDFKLLDRKAVDALLSVTEYHAFFRALSSWIGFKATSVSYDVQEREEGVSKWSTKSLIKYAVNNISEFSSAPLHIVTWLGIFLFVITAVVGVQTLVRYLSGNAAEGFTTVILLQLFTASVIMIAVGIVGFYLAKVYDEVKRRPRYIISKMK